MKVMALLVALAVGGCSSMPPTKYIVGTVVVGISLHLLLDGQGRHHKGPVGPAGCDLACKSHYPVLPQAGVQ